MSDLERFEAAEKRIKRLVEDLIICWQDADLLDAASDAMVLLSTDRDAMVLLLAEKRADLARNREELRVR